MAGSQLVVIADDLTGAADAGAPFASAGFAVVVPLAKGDDPGAGVVAYSTEGRDLSGPEAARRVRAVIDLVQSGASPAAWYKKIDSALRGHPAIEIATVMEAIKAERVLIAPALPAEGRVVTGGEVRVYGVPLHETPLGRGRASSAIAEGLREVHAAPITLVGLADVRGPADRLAGTLSGEQPTVFIADAVTDDDLDRLAAAAIGAQIPLLAGSAGLARSLAGVMASTPGDAIRPEPVHRQKPVLIVAGSRHQVCEQQIDAACCSGASRVQLPRVDRPLTASEARGTSRQVATALGSGCPAILTTAGMGSAAVSGDLIADQLAWIATDHQVLERVGGMVLTGGDVAAAVCRRLDADALWLGGEVLPAIPWAIVRGGKLPYLPIVTKAGSFGPADALLRSLDFLNSATGTLA